MPGSGQALYTTAIDSAANGIGRPARDRLREGYIEIIEMGVLTGAAAAAATPAIDAAPDCQTLEDRWTEGGVWTNDPSFELAPPSGGLSGHAWLVDVFAGHAYDYSAIAIDRFSGQQLHREPALELGLDAAHAPAPAASDKTRSTIYVDGSFTDLLWDRPVDAVSSVLMTSQLQGEFSIEEELAGATEIITTLPTKRHYVFEQYANGLNVPQPPFGNEFGTQGLIAACC